MTLLASNRFRSNHVNTYREEERESYDGHSNLNWTSIVCKIVDLFVCLFVSLCISLLFIMKNGQFAFYIWNGARIIREYINGSSSKHGANDYCPSHEAIGQEAKKKNLTRQPVSFDGWCMTMNHLVMNNEITFVVLSSVQAIEILYINMNAKWWWWREILFFFQMKQIINNHTYLNECSHVNKAKFSIGQSITIFRMEFLNIMIHFQL